ncbi:MAG: hypothetical protein A3J67_05820 [Parcubacteria group bacterium RIFCSPHIGHO2_02_FULL_48_10b]|nr:MAG: hypothetical protein A3J67_05820 [Parcubacteria group bacterium RIFCSPHIGHO2_02_FULL_48_10b]
MTLTEKKFFGVLEQVVGGKYRIENQVQLSRIVSPRDSNKHYINYQDFNRIKAKSIDLFCTMKIIDLICASNLMIALIRSKREWKETHLLMR